MLRTKSVWTKIEPKVDGLRLLVTRFRGRGLPAKRYDVWMPSLGPSERLLAQVLRGKIAWSKFAREFRAELVLDGPIDARSRSIKNHGQKFTLRLIHTLSRKGNITLLCHCDEDQLLCHRHVLKALIDSGRI